MLLFCTKFNSLILIRFAVKDSEYILNGLLYGDEIIATFDGLDLTVASIEIKYESLQCETFIYWLYLDVASIKSEFTNEANYEFRITSSLCSKTFSGSNLRSMFDDEPIERNCNVHMVGRHFNYSYKIIDRLMSEQLWPTNGPPLLADIEFVVSGVVFKAHRAIVCARSPVFAAMFACGMSESETGRVEIIDASPETFADFLKFVYTEQLDTPCFANSQLGYCADKYEVKTLSDLCSGLSLANMDPDSFKSALMTSGRFTTPMYENGLFLCSLFLRI